MVKNLKVLRVSKGISQQRLAVALGTSQQSINKYENHGIEPDICMLMKIADYFGTSVDYLVGHSLERNENIERISMKLNLEETRLIEEYRLLSDKEKDSIRLVIDNYLKN